ncbi:hypothetical protein [Nostoc sp. FACHB-152]|nr:hypothetical protein [Nostoc sp. FACHB-152]
MQNNRSKYGYSKTFHSQPAAIHQLTLNTTSKLVVFSTANTYVHKG